MPARVGDKADPERDDIRLDGRSLTRPQARTYLMLHKPRGYVTTLSDEKGRRTVAELVRSCGARVWPVGRLDLDSEGLLLMTDDGALTHRLTHPSHEVEKEYRVWVNGDTAAGLPVLRGPMSLDGVPLRPARVTLLEQTPRGDVLSVVIHEGKNRQVRRMCDAAGLTVKRLAAADRRRNRTFAGKVKQLAKKDCILSRFPLSYNLKRISVPRAGRVPGGRTA